MQIEITVATISAIAAITAAFMSGIVALTSTVIAKEQKISEFRQAWIDALREDCSKLLTQNIAASNYTKEILANPKGSTHDYNAAQLAVSELTHKVKLRLNPVDDKIFIDKICLLSKSYSIKSDKENDKNPFNFDDNLNQIETLTDEIHSIMNTEWKRVKQGELINRFFIASGKILIWASLTAILVLVLSSNFPQYCPIAG